MQRRRRRRREQTKRRHVCFGELFIFPPYLHPATPLGESNGFKIMCVHKEPKHIIIHEPHQGGTAANEYLCVFCVCVCVFIYFG